MDNSRDTDDVTIGTGTGDRNNPFNIDASSDTDRRGFNGIGTGIGGFGRRFFAGGNSSGTGTGTGTRAGTGTGVSSAEKPVRKPRIKKSQQGIILPWEWVASALPTISRWLAVRIRPSIDSDGNYIWQLNTNESTELAKAVVPLGKYIPITLPEASTQLMKDLKPVLDALIIIGGQRILVEQMIIAANRPTHMPSNNGTVVIPPDYENTMEVPQVINIGPMGYDMNKDRRGTL